MITSPQLWSASPILLSNESVAALCIILVENLAQKRSCVWIRSCKLLTNAGELTCMVEMAYLRYGSLWYETCACSSQAHLLLPSQALSEKALLVSLTALASQNSTMCIL